MNAQGYLEQTGDAVKQLIRAGSEYEQILADRITPLQEPDELQLKEYMAAAEEYFGLQFSQAALCGSILQVAFMALDLFSANTTISPDCVDLVGTSVKAVKFSLGRRVHGIPIGLLIYAGRNQYNHWDDESFDYPTTQVFRALMQAYYDNPLFDMAFELNYPARTTKSHYIVRGELGWRDYDRYQRDMKELFGL
jgi:hypothetical protein